MTRRLVCDHDGASADDRAADAALLARIADLPWPAPPPGLADRIIREVPRLAQLPAYAEARTNCPVSALSVVVQPTGRPDPRRARTWTGRAAGLAALAAGIAAFALIAPQTMPVRPVAATRHSAGMVASSRTIALARLSAPRAIPTHAMRAPTPVDDDGHDAPAVDEPRAPDPAPVTADPVPAPVASDIAVAVAAPAFGPSSGPADAASGMSAPLGAHGLMGPTLPQGYGFTGNGGDFGAGHGGSMGSGPGPH